MGGSASVLRLAGTRVGGLNGLNEHGRAYV